MIRTCQNATDLIWLQTGFLGDIILTTAAIRLAKIRLPKSRHHLVTTALGKKALWEFHDLDSITVFEKDALSFVRSFQKVRQALLSEVVDESRTVVLQPHGSYRSSFLSRFLGFKTITYEETHAGWLADVRVPRVAVFHEAARIGMLLAPLGIHREDILKARPVLTPRPLPTEREWAKDLSIHDGKVVGIAPGSVWGTKRWTKEGFAQLVKHLSLKAGVRVLLLGSHKETALCKEIVDLAACGDRRSVTNLAGRTSLDDLRSLFPRMDLLVSNDSSPIHYASAFNVPTIALFGATVPEMGFSPLAEGSKSLGVPMECRPCSDHGPDECPLKHFKCMNTLSPDQVLEACEPFLK